MQIDPDQAARIIILLRGTKPYADDTALTVSSHPLWLAWDTALLALRLPLYHQRLGKRAPKPAAQAVAIQRGLALLAAFAACSGTHQIIVSSQGGWIRSISFQPRPFNMSWTAEHAITPTSLVTRTAAFQVSVEDILHLAAYVTYAISGCNAGQIVDLTATLKFLQQPDSGALLATAVLYQHASRQTLHATLN